MAGAYVDTSALGRVLFGEPDAPAVLRELARFEEHVSSRLLAVELRRLALRFDVTEQADELLGGVALVPLDEGLLREAEVVLPREVATLDAIHLATALRLVGAGYVGTIVTYDERLLEAASYHRVPAVAPR